MSLSSSGNPTPLVLAFCLSNPNRHRQSAARAEMHARAYVSPVQLSNRSNVLAGGIKCLWNTQSFQDLGVGAPVMQLKFEHALIHLCAKTSPVIQHKSRIKFFLQSWECSMQKPTPDLLCQILKVARKFNLSLED